MARRVFYQRSGTLDAIPGDDDPEPKGLTVSRESKQGSWPGRFVAQLPGSPADYFIAASGDGSGRADLWEVEHARGDVGVNPLDSDEVRQRLASADRAYVRQPTADRGIALGRAVRERDSARLRAVNLANRRGPHRAA